MSLVLQLQSTDSSVSKAFICCMYIQLALKEMVMEMDVRAECIRMHGNGMLNFTDLFKFMQEFRNLWTYIIRNEKTRCLVECTRTIKQLL